MTATTEIDPDLAPAAPYSAGPAAGSLADVVGIVPDLFAPARPVDTLQIVVTLARQTFGCDGAGVVLTARGGFTAAVASGTDAAQAEAMQVEYREGPALDAIAVGRAIVIPDLRFDSRWRFWGPKAADLGFRSAWSLALADSAPFGALTLYSRTASFFPHEPLGPELGFVQQVAIAIAVAVERDHLVRAREARTVVGQAQGILMERYQITADEAFGILRRYSSVLNRKLRLVAERVVSERNLPELGLTN